MGKLKDIAYRSLLNPAGSKKFNNRENKRFSSLNQSIYDYRSKRKTYIEKFLKSELDIQNLKDIKSVINSLEKQIEDLKKLIKNSIEVE